MWQADPSAMRQDPTTSLREPMEPDVLLLLPGDEQTDDQWTPGAWPEPASSHQPPATQILLVEGDPVVRRLVERLLIDAGYSVLSASHGRDALEVARQATIPVDLTITDVRMPGMDGWELGRRLRERWPELPVLYLSGYDGEVDRFVEARTPRAGFMTKPFDPDELLWRVALLLDQG